MGQPTFYYYPDDGGSLETLALGGNLSDLHVTPLRSRASALNGQGSPRFAVREGGLRVRIVRERSLTAAVVRGLESLQNHLYRGGRVGFSRDGAKAWAAYYVGGMYMERGRSVVYTPGNAFTSWSASTIGAADEVVIESNNPDFISEMRTVTSVNSGGDVTLAEAMDFTRSTRGIIRWRDFWPCLFLPDDGIGKPIYTHEHGIAYTLDMELQYDPAILDAAGDEFVGLSSLADSSSPEASGAFDSLESIVGAAGRLGALALLGSRTSMRIR